MFSSRIAAALLSSVLIAGSAVPLIAQATRPDFSGQWEQDPEASKALTEKHGYEWRVAGAGMGGGTAGSPPPDAVIIRPVTIITQTEIVVERRYDGEVMSRDVYKLDGSVSVNASRTGSSRSTTVWKGNSLVTTGTLELDMSAIRATDASGRPIVEITRDFVTTRTLMPDGTMHVESRTVQDGDERVSWAVLVRVKSS